MILNLFSRKRPQPPEKQRIPESGGWIRVTYGLIWPLPDRARSVAVAQIGSPSPRRRVFVMAKAGVYGFLCAADGPRDTPFAAISSSEYGRSIERHVGQDSKPREQGPAFAPLLVRLEAASVVRFHDNAACRRRAPTSNSIESEVWATAATIREQGISGIISEDQRRSGGRNCLTNDINGLASEAKNIRELAGATDQGIRRLPSLLSLPGLRKSPEPIFDPHISQPRLRPKCQELLPKSPLDPVQQATSALMPPSLG